MRSVEGMKVLVEKHRGGWHEWVDGEGGGDVEGEVKWSEVAQVKGDAA